MSTEWQRKMKTSGSHGCIRVNNFETCQLTGNTDPKSSPFYEKVLRDTFGFTTNFIEHTYYVLGDFHKYLI